MLTLLLAGLVPIARLASATESQRRVKLQWLLGLVLLGLSVLVKYATLLIGVLSAVIWARELRDWRTRAGWVGGTLLLISGLSLALYWPWLAGLQMLSPAFDEINGKYQFHSVPVVLQRLLGEWLPSVTDLTPEVAALAARFWIYGLARLLFVLYLAWELKRLWTATERPPAVQVICAVSARALLIALLLVLTEVHSWYFTWPLALVTLLGWRSRLTQLVVGYTLTCLPVDYVALFDLHAMVPIPVRVVLGLGYLGLPVMIPAAISMRRLSVALIRNRQRASLGALADFP
jgi:hypothetical protein